ncbi:MAG TPA: chromate efflux transporter [Myxococcota bacterium]|nr:chromate efflux transporter [Myxococcota bacterium]
MVSSDHASRSARLRELALLFLRLGSTAFGGPAAHIALMEEEVVQRRGWLSRERFLDLLGAANLIPGPNSTEVAIHIGHARAGWPGLVVAGLSFIVPAAAIVTACAWAYVRFGALPAFAGFLYGVKPVVIVIVAQALWRLGRTAIRSVWLGALALAAAAANAFGADEIGVLAASAGLSVFVKLGREHARRAAPLTGMGALGVGATSVSSAAFGLWPLFFFFAKVGSVLFGSGYVLLAFLRSGLVEQRGWLTEAQLLDAVAVGQVTPGPLFTTATFVGYVIAGPAGAAVATLGIFLPAFAFVAASAPFLPRLRESPTAGALLDGVNAASLALMAVVTVQLARAAFADPLALGLAAAAGVALLARPGWSSAWLVFAGGVIGLLSGRVWP